MSLAVLNRNTQTGLSTWTFNDTDGIFSAVSSAGKVITCSSVEELRGVYRKFIAWGFKLRKSAPAPVRRSAVPFQRSFYQSCVYNTPVRVTEEECQRIADARADK